MDVANIDVRGIRRKTSRVPQLSPEERTRVGRLLQRLRETHTPRLRQADIAKKLGCVIATVQNIEHNKHKVNRDTIEQYAAVFGMTAQQLLQPESLMIAPSDSRYADLNHEHLQIARRYMRAVDAVRGAVKVLLSDNDAIAEEYAEALMGLKRLGEATREQDDLTFWMEIIIGHADILRDLAQHLDDPGFKVKLLTLINDAPTKGKK